MAAAIVEDVADLAEEEADVVELHEVVAVVVCN